MVNLFRLNGIRNQNCSMASRQSTAIILVAIAIFFYFSSISNAQLDDTSTTPTLPDGPPSESVLESMWRLGMYASANEVCELQIQQSEPGSNSQARWTMWLIRGLAGEAVELEDQSEPDLERSKQLWDKIDDLVKSPQQAPTLTDRTPWIVWQSVHANLWRAQAQMANYLANPLNTQSRENALESIRLLDNRSEQLTKDISKRIEQLASSSDGASRRSIRDLQELSTETALLKCEAMLLRGQAYPYNSADTIAAGTEMEHSATIAASKMAEDWSGSSKLKLAIAASKWLQGKVDESMELLVPLLQSNDLRVRHRALDLYVQCALASGQPERAKTILDQFRSSVVSPEQALAQLRVALFDLPAESNAASVRQTAIEDLLATRDAIGNRFGNYWKRRAEALLSSVSKATATTSRPPSLEIVRIEVRQLLDAKRFDEAIAKLIQQAALLQKKNESDSAIGLLLQAAAISQKTSRWQPASELYRQASLLDPTHKDAAASHLMAIYCSEQDLRNKSNSTTLKQYQDLLKEQLEQFPGNPVSLQAAKQFSHLMNNLKQWKRAAEELRPSIAKVIFTKELFWIVLENDFRATYWQFNEGDPAASQYAIQAFNQWNQIATGTADNKAATADSHQLASIAMLLMTDLLPESIATSLPKQKAISNPENFLKSLNDQTDDPSVKWITARKFVLQTRDKAKLQQPLPAPWAKELLSFFERTDSTSSNAQEISTKPLSIALWTALENSAEQAELLAPDERWQSRDLLQELLKILDQGLADSAWKQASLDRGNRLRWRLEGVGPNRLQALNQVGERIKSQPRNATWNRTRAVLLETGDKEELEEALGIYRKLATGARIGSEDWLQARYRSALCLLWMGNKEDAKQTADVILLTHPPQSQLWQERWKKLATE
ncbi:MAG: hypothetical protein RLY14_1475 [Planctomycetota bacterium]|jgi:hypothetical protein